MTNTQDPDKNTQKMIENFGKKRNTNGFDKRPLDTKKGGRKKGSFKSIISSLQENGFEPVTKMEYRTLLALILNLPKQKLDQIQNLVDTPEFVKITLAAFKDKSYQFKMIRFSRDWLFGKEGLDKDAMEQTYGLSSEQTKMAEERALQYLEKAKRSKAEREALQ